MSYRDDLEAGRRREAALAEKLAEKERELEELRKSKAPAPEAPQATEPSPADDSVRDSSAGSTKSAVAAIGGVGLALLLPALGIVGPCVCEMKNRAERAEREAAAAKDEALFTRKMKAEWAAKVERSEGLYFPPDTTCKVTLDARSDGNGRLRGTLATTCGTLRLYEQAVDQIACQLEEASGTDTYRYRLRCLPPEMDEHWARLMDLDTKLTRAVVNDAERKGHVVLHVDEWSETRSGPSFLAK